MINPVPLIKRKRGASSVLVILMMIVLIVFGLAALTTSLAAKRLGEKSGRWLEEYYILEGMAHETLFDIDGLLIQAETAAVDYIESKSYLTLSSPVLPEGLQENIYRNFTYVLPEHARDEYLVKVMKAVFYKTALDILLEKYPVADFNYSAGYLREILEDEGFTGMNITFTVSEDEPEHPKNIDITLEIISPAYKLEAADESFTVLKLPSSLMRYKVIQWREWQEYFDYSEKAEYEDPF